LSARPNRAKRYARRCAPDLVAVAAFFALPLLLHYGTKINHDSSLERISLVIMCIVPSFSVGLKFSILGVSSWKESKYELYALLTITIIYFVSFWVFNSVLMQVVILIITTALTFWFFPYCFLQNKKTQLDEFKKIGWSGFFIAGFFLLFAYLFASSPVEIGQNLGATNVLLTAVLAYVSVGYLLSWGFWWLGRLPCSRDNPVPLNALRLVLLMAIAWRLLSASFGDAELRKIGVDGGNPSDATSYLNEWIASRNAHATKEWPYPVFIVTAEGGGIRAAYWTATVLGALQDQFPDFADHVLAMSGVSGGSVGASIFAALVIGAAEDAEVRRKEGGYEACALKIARGDLLSPPLASMLLAAPLSLITGKYVQADRAVALEQALERSWESVMNNDRFAEPFKNVAANAKGMLLLPNSTSAGSGQRIVISSLATDAMFKPAYTLDGRPLALSTATLLSARFPAISPAALYEKTPERWIRIVDGGYSDNSGAATGADVLRALGAALDHAQVKERFRPVVIAITNSAVTEEEGIARGGFRSLTLGALLDPVETLGSVSGTASARFQDDLRTRVKELGGIYLEGMRLSYGKADLPLGWMLAPVTTLDIDTRRNTLKADTQGDFQRVGKLLDGTEKTRSGASLK
jgi:predicted acylesterase/phospholipase RssA